MTRVGFETPADHYVRPEGFSLPHQHFLLYYCRLIELFGAPNGVCTSITENKHIKAVKKPYRRSNHNKLLGQMLITNQRIDKLAAAHMDFTARGMLHGTGLPSYLLGEDGLLAESLMMDPARRPLLPDDDDNMELGAVQEPMSQSEIQLARTYGMFSC